MLLRTTCLLLLLLVAAYSYSILRAFPRYAFRGQMQLSFSERSDVVSSEAFPERASSPIVMDEEDGDEEEDEQTLSTMPSITPSMVKEGLSFTGAALNGSDVRVGILMARWNADIVQGLYKGVNESLTACGVKPTNVFTTYVPGAFELPLTAKFLAASKRVDVIICLGCLIKGETMHFEVIAQATADGLMRVGMDSYVPVIFGVLTVYNKEQAIARSTGAKNEGLGWGKSAVEMGLARMSALGLGSAQKQLKEESSATQFVNFNSTVSGTKTASNSTKKSFGF